MGRLFPQEYPEDPQSCFLVSGQSYFDDLKVSFDEIFSAPMKAEYDPTHRYCAGLDFGQQDDYTVMPVHDMTARCQVDLLRINHLSWSEMRRRVADKYKYWHLPRLLAETNSMGSTNIEELRKLGVSVVPFTTDNTNKAAIIQGMHEKLDEGWKLQAHEVQKHEMRIFVSSQTASGLWRLAAAGNGHDDTIIGNALALESSQMMRAGVDFV